MKETRLGEYLVNLTTEERGLTKHRNNISAFWKSPCSSLPLVGASSSHTLPFFCSSRAPRFSHRPTPTAQQSYFSPSPTNSPSKIPVSYQFLPPHVPRFNCFMFPHFLSVLCIPMRKNFVPICWLFLLNGKKALLSLVF